MPLEDTRSLPGGTFSSPRIAQRYDLRKFLGGGGGGRVWLAHDRLTNTLVALKRLHSSDHGSLIRIRRETLALHTLNIPGVVGIRDEGEDEEGFFFVMDYVAGEPFPGAKPPVSWEWLSSRLWLLLETLSEIHHAGIVHRDLKPSNVLVTPEGRPVVLDFGIARGLPLGQTITAHSQVMGTPLYLAPESLLGGEVDARTDLYGVGLLAWYALVGSSPRRKTQQGGFAPLPPIATLAELPDEAAHLIDGLLEPHADERPPSAAHALRFLEPTASQRYPLPLLRRDDVLEKVVAKLAAGQRPRVHGAPGHGAQRFLGALEAALRPRPVARTVAGTRPFSSLIPVLGDLPDQDLAATHTECEHRLAALGETVLLVASEDQLDRWSREIIKAHPHTVSVTQEGTADVELEPFDVSDLMPLFDGPERLLRLRTRAAEILYRRTNGVPAHVSSELRNWVRQGYVDEPSENGTFHVNAHALDKMEAGLAGIPPRTPPRRLKRDLDDLLAWIWLGQPQVSSAQLLAVTSLRTFELEGMLLEMRDLGCIAGPDDALIPRVASVALQQLSTSRVNERHAKLANSLRTGSIARARHLVLAGQATQAAAEATELALHAEAQGHPTLGLAVLESLARVVDDGQRPAVLGAWTAMALVLRTPEALDQARRALMPHLGQPLIAAWHALLCARESMHETDSNAWNLLESLDVPPEAGPLFRRWYAILRMETAKEDTDRANSVIESYDEDASPELRRRTKHWRGLVAYRSGDFAASAEYHRESSDASNTLSTVSALINEAGAWLEHGDYAQAIQVAERGLALSTAQGFLRFAARGEWILRSARYRRGDLMEPDRELLSAVESLGIPPVIALVATLEAAVAWRHRHADAHELANAAHRHASVLGNMPVALLAHAMAVFYNRDLEAAQQVASMTQRCTLSGIAIQALSLVAPLLPAYPREQLQQLAEQFPREMWDRRREVLSISEAMALDCHP